MNTRTIVAVGLVAALFFQVHAFAEGAVASGTGVAAAADPEEAARETWRSLVVKNPPGQSGCFHASYPNYTWESADCGEAQLRAHPLQVASVAVVPGVAGYGNDYVARTQGLMSEAQGEFSASNVTSVSSLPVASFGNGGILGANQYSIQLNTNNDGSGSYACEHVSGCTVWQQFFYSTDLVTIIPGLDYRAGLYMQYWLLYWDSSACPKNWIRSSYKDQPACYKNSTVAWVPNIPISTLGAVKMHASATPGGNDEVTLAYSTDAWSVTASDSVLEIGYYWQEAEFNVLGDCGGSLAEFNEYASVNVKLSVSDGSSIPPTCVAQEGTTGETNNFTLGGSCQVEPSGVSGLPYAIAFSESVLPTPPPVISHCPPAGCKGTQLD
jgi:hypothetical protein